MSPEQVRGQGTGRPHRSVLVRRGAVRDGDRARCRSGRHARQSSSTPFWTAAPTPAVRLNPDVPAKLEDIINKALEKDRDLRYQHASEMRGDLQRLKRDTDTGRIPMPAADGRVAAKGHYGTDRVPAGTTLRHGWRQRAPSKTATGKSPEKLPRSLPPLRSRFSLFFSGSSNIALRRR